jgi:hypothetical protein
MYTKRDWGIDLEPSTRHSPGFFGQSLGRVYLRQDIPGSFIKRFADLSEVLTSGRSVQETHAQVLFERLHVFTHQLRRHRESLCGGRERAELNSLGEDAHTAQASFDEPDAYPVDIRGLTYSYAYVGIKRLGAGQFYLISIKDKDGHAFDGSKTFRLNVPANVPVEQYWSLTAYDRETHALIRNMPRASRSSQIPELQKNADGSVDIFLGPKAPKGKDANWIPTDARRDFEVMFRLYAPTKASSITCIMRFWRVAGWVLFRTATL